jgi:curved DNA-binding protein
MTEKWENNWKDYYKILKIDDTSVKPEVIEKAYRKLSQKYKYEARSDQLSSRKLSDVQEAYKILGKLEKRARYDSMYLENKQMHSKDYQPKLQLFEKIIPRFFRNNPKC